MYLVIENKDRGLEDRRALALALVSGAWTQDPSDLFPVLRERSSVEEPETDEEREALLNDPNIEDAKPTPAEEKEISAWLAEHEKGFVTGDLEGGRSEWH